MIPDPVGSGLSPAPYVSDSDTAKMTEQNNLNFIFNYRCVDSGRRDQPKFSLIRILLWAFNS